MICCNGCSEGRLWWQRALLPCERLGIHEAKAVDGTAQKSPFPPHQPGGRRHPQWRDRAGRLSPLTTHHSLLLSDIGQHCIASGHLRPLQKTSISTNLL